MEPLATLSPSHQQPQHPHQHQQRAHHQVPFGHLPTQPGSLSHGFGLSPASAFGLSPSWASASTSASPSSSPGPSWRASPAWGARSSPAAQQAAQAATPPSAQAGSRRRRRSPSVESDEDREEMREEGRGGPGGGGGKKARVGTGVGPNSASASPQLSLVQPVNSTDLGKALASLPKESLLTLLTSLLTSQPALRPTVAALLPPPTLPTTLASLHTLERAVLAALPAGHDLREDYVWGRVRVSLEDYTSSAKSFLTTFCAPSSPSSTSTPTGGTTEDEIGHPSTTFAFLYALTSSLRRLEVALPHSPSPATTRSNPLAGHLLPLTINAWHALLTRLNGRVLSATLLRGWFDRIDELCVDSPGGREGGAKRACEGVRERMRRELGWLIGVRPSAVQINNSVMMDDEEEL